MNKNKHVVVIGAGFSGLSTAAYLAHGGFDVTILEQNRTSGGRVTSFKKNGYTFEITPNFYRAPELYEDFFNDFDRSTSDFYKLKRLDPSYRVFFSGNRFYDLSSSRENANLFSQLEPGASVELEKILLSSKKQYVGLKKDILKINYDKKSFLNLIKLMFQKNYHNLIKQYFQDPRIHQILEYPTINLGSLPNQTLGMYSGLIHSDMNLGIWHTEGGFKVVAKAIEKIAKKYGVIFKFRSKVTSIEVKNNQAVAVRTGRKRYTCDFVVSACDYQYTENKLLKSEYRSYSTKYWQNQTYSPSAVIINLGLDIKLSNLEHHNIFLDTNWDETLKYIFKNKKIPDQPIFQVSIPSKTTSRMAPKNCDALTIMLPMPNSVDIDEQELSSIKQNVYSRIGERVHLDLSKHIVFEDIKSKQYFIDAFNATNGNLNGLSNLRSLVVVDRPTHQSQKVNNLFYSGLDMNSGLGMPFCLQTGKKVVKIINSII